MDGIQYGEVFANRGYFATIYPVLDTKRKAGNACVRHFVKRLACRTRSRPARRPRICSRCVRKNDIDLHVIKPERHNNPYEGGIQEFRRKQCWFRTMVRSRVPQRKFWDYGMRRVCKVMQKSSRQAGGLHGCCTPIESVTGETNDILEYLDFGFYNSVWYHKNTGLGERLPGCWLGVSHCVGSLMLYYVLAGECTVISCMTVQRVSYLFGTRSQQQ
jgi:hypothetical protein